MTSLGSHFICLDNLDVAVERQDHPEERLRQELRDIAVHGLLDEYYSRLTAHGVAKSPFSLRLVEDCVDVASLVVVQVEVSLSLDHQLSEVSAAGRNDLQEVVVSEVERVLAPSCLVGFY